MTSADRLVEAIEAGAPEMLLSLLHLADMEDDARNAVRQLGNHWREDGVWRGVLKRSGEWDALAVQIHPILRRGDSDPWWHILDFADGQEVTQTVSNFFDSGTE